jgi:multiple sugar transport system permease protein
VNKTEGSVKHNKIRRRKLIKTLVGLTFICIFLFPLYWMINVSVQPGHIAVNTPIFPLHVSGRGYKMAWNDQKIHLFNSLIYAIGEVLVGLTLATPAAYALAKLKIRGVKYILLGILITQMIPGVVIANALYNFYVKIHLLNTIPGIILAGSTLGVPFSILLMTSYMQNLQKEIIEAAAIDGANSFQTFFRIVVPMSKNVIITSAVFTFLFGWGDFIYSVALISKAKLTPITVSLYMYVSSNQGADYSPIMATAVLSSIPAVLLLIFAQKYVRTGVTTGAVK